MKKVIIILIFISTNLFSNMGINIGSQVNNSNNDYDELISSGTITPSIFWEIYKENFGFGMTYTVDLIRMDSNAKSVDYDWFIDWESTFDMKYHILGTKNDIDPYAELSFGLAASNMTQYYKRNDSYWEEGPDGKYYYNEEKGKNYGNQSLQTMEIIGRFNAGVNFNYKKMFIGAKAGVAVLNNQFYSVKGDLEDVLESYRLSFILGYKF